MIDGKADTEEDISGIRQGNTGTYFFSNVHINDYELDANIIHIIHIKKWKRWDVK